MSERPWAPKDPDSPLTLAHPLSCLEPLSFAPLCSSPVSSSLSLTPSSGPTEPPARVVAPEASQTRVRSSPGGDLELAVQLSAPGGPVRWYKDGERLASQGRVQLEQAGVRHVLRVQGARSWDAGEYLCDAPQDSRIFLVSVEGNSAPSLPWDPRNIPLLYHLGPPELLQPSGSNPNTCTPMPRRGLRPSSRRLQEIGGA